MVSVNDDSFIFQYQRLLEEATREKEHLTIEIEYVFSPKLSILVSNSNVE